MIPWVEPTRIPGLVIRNHTTFSSPVLRDADAGHACFAWDEWYGPFLNGR
jgi:hypothetical protein